MTRQSRRLLFTTSAVAVVTLIGSAPARADFVPFTGRDAACTGNICDLFLNADTSVTSGKGSVGSQGGSPVVTFTSGGSVPIDIKNGYSSISPSNNSEKTGDEGTSKDQDLFSLTFTAPAGSDFTDFSFRGSLEDAGKVTISGSDTLSNLFSYDFNIGTKGNFERIGVFSKNGTEDLSSVTITADSATDGFDFVKQMQFSTGVPSIVPLPPALALFSSGLVGLGVLARRRRAKQSAPSA